MDTTPKMVHWMMLTAQPKQHRSIISITSRQCVGTGHTPSAVAKKIVCTLPKIQDVLGLDIVKKALLAKM